MRYILVLISFLLYQETLTAQECPSQCNTILPPLNFQPHCPSWWSQGWGITIYSGPITSQDSSKIFLKGKAKFEGSAILAVAASKRLVSFLDNRLDLEFETQGVKHFGGQTHFEINPVVLIARWKAFPWNATLPTTIAIGDGLSIATNTPKIELAARGAKYTSRVLNYLMAEITLSLPCSHWALVARYHHRSGAFGTFNGVHDASTAFAAGLKYWF